MIFSFLLNVSAISFDLEVWKKYYQDTLNIIDPHKTLLLAQKYFHLTLTLALISC